MLKQLVLVTLAALNLAAVAGCSKVPGMAGGVALGKAAHTATIQAAGRARKLGFDLDRAKQQAPAARLQKLPPVQGLMPTRVDLRDVASGVYDQQDLGSCTAFAVGKGVRELLQNVRGEQATPLSALFLYYETRKLRNAVDLDSGATITDAMKAIAGSGVAPEAAWPYDIGVFAQKPPQAAYKAATPWKLTTGIQIGGLDEIKKALARKQPVVAGMRLYKSFRDVGADGQLQMPQNGDIMVGGHAITIVGYDNQKRHLIVKNSFGTAWGDKGYFYMPYAYVNPELVLDIWTAS
jgi:C1A family cysteine protease